VKSVIMTQS